MSWLPFSDYVEGPTSFHASKAGDPADGLQVLTDSPGRGSGTATDDLSQAPASSRRPTLANSRVYRERVLVRVYDLGQTMLTRVHNGLTKSYGAFHTGVEVYGKEWSFGMTFDNYSSGITCHEPGQNSDHTFRETLSMGYTRFSPKEVGKILEDMKRDWKGRDYHVLTKNCHHFSDSFCARLGVAHLPEWVNTLAETGANTLDYLDSTDSGYDGGKAITDFFDNMKSSVFGFFTGAPSSTQATFLPAHGKKDTWGFVPR
eukprot:CAMPEP_0181536112 /NCGR_PEP_ID=MMETSP1110-20121109/74633_1 /TAXON_ID=174948 /ORGANISM="Symbiodinium sp., Strain CCMP421" /LENGTH=258 /DNA_ID=CAMNT_0023667573 /DNA_START=53 /DNA_END=825 /DNA_ORIENTATION=+